MSWTARGEWREEGRYGEDREELLVEGGGERTKRDREELLVEGGRG